MPEAPPSWPEAAKVGDQVEVTVKTVLESGMVFRNPAVSMGLPGLSEYQLWRTDENAVRAVRRLLDAKP